MSMFRILLGVVLALGQTGAQFAGTWTASYGGETFVRLELQELNGALTGRISLGSMHVDRDGVVDHVLAPANNFTPIFDVAIRDGMLSFARKDGDDTDRFELRRIGDAVELRFLFSSELAEEFARDNIPQPVPIRLTRAAAP